MIRDPAFSTHLNTQLAHKMNVDSSAARIEREKGGISRLRMSG